MAASLLWDRLLPLVLVVALLFWAARWLANGRISLRTPADWGVLILVVMGLLSLRLSAFPQITSIQVYRLLAGIAFFYALLNWGDFHTRLSILTLGMGLAGAALALTSPISVQWSVGKLPFIPAQVFDRFTLLVSDTIHPNVLARSLVILLLLPLNELLFAWSETGSWRKTALIGCVGLIFGALILTQSRGAWLAIGVLAVLMITLRWRRGWISLPAVLVTGLAIVLFFGCSQVIDILSSSSTITGFAGRVEIRSWALRR